MHKPFNVIETNNFKIECLGVQELDVYDIEVEKNHNFFANNILVHNSGFVDIQKFIEDNDLLDYFNSLEEDEKIKWVKRIASNVEDYVNEKSYTLTQKAQLGSSEEEFKISFKSENVFRAGFWVRKKKYFLYIIDEEGVRPKEPLSVIGLETVRSDTPVAVKPYLKQVMLDILLGLSDEEFQQRIYQYKDELKTASPTEIAQNIGCHDMDSYYQETKEINEMLKTNDSKSLFKKGTPRHVKGVFALRDIAKSLNIEDKVELVQDGDKACVVYLKDNKWNIETLSFLKWIPEFNEAGLEIDYDKMISKVFLKKLEMFLEPIGKIDLLNENAKLIDDFFG